jgi:hypothetical protein
MKLTMQEMEQLRGILVREDTLRKDMMYIQEIKQLTAMTICLSHGFKSLEECTIDMGNGIITPKELPKTQ